MLDNLLDKRSEKRETGRDKHFVAIHGGSEFAKICQRTDPNDKITYEWILCQVYEEGKISILDFAPGLKENPAFMVKCFHN